MLPDHIVYRNIRFYALHISIIFVLVVAYNRLNKERKRGDCAVDLHIWHAALWKDAWGQARTINHLHDTLSKSARQLYGDVANKNVPKIYPQRHMHVRVTVLGHKTNLRKHCTKLDRFYNLVWIFFCFYVPATDNVFILLFLNVSFPEEGEL